MYQQDENDGLSGWLWCVIIAFAVGFLLACGLLIVDDERGGDLLNRSVEDPQAREKEELGLVILCTVTSCAFAMVIFGVWKGISYYNSPEQERKRILRRHPPLYGRH
jgi:hypothetical protein